MHGQFLLVSRPEANVLGAAIAKGHIKLVRCPNSSIAALLTDSGACSSVFNVRDAVLREEGLNLRQSHPHPLEALTQALSVSVSSK